MAAQETSTLHLPRARSVERGCGMGKCAVDEVGARAASGVSAAVRAVPGRTEELPAGGCGALVPQEDLAHEAFGRGLVNAREDGRRLSAIITYAGRWGFGERGEIGRRATAGGDEGGRCSDRNG